jgi:hypothetical protein
MTDLIKQFGYDAYILPWASGYYTIGVSIDKGDCVEKIIWSYRRLYL